MKTVLLNTNEDARGVIGFIGEEITPRTEEHYGVAFSLQPDGSRTAEVTDIDAALMVDAGRVIDLTAADEYMDSLGLTDEEGTPEPAGYSDVEIPA